MELPPNGSAPPSNYLALLALLILIPILIFIIWNTRKKRQSQKDKDLQAMGLQSTTALPSQQPIDTEMTGVVVIHGATA